MLCNAVYPSNIWYSVVNILQVFHICRSTDTPPPPLTNTVESCPGGGVGGGEGGSEVARVIHFTQSPHINIYPRLAGCPPGQWETPALTCGLYLSPLPPPTSPLPPPHSRTAPSPPHSRLAPTVQYITSISARLLFPLPSRAAPSPPQSRLAPTV
jgi:hypothetical protein